MQLLPVSKQGHSWELMDQTLDAGNGNSGFGCRWCLVHPWMESWMQTQWNVSGKKKKQKTNLRVAWNRKVMVNSKLPKRREPYFFSSPCICAQCHVTWSCLPPWLSDWPYDLIKPTEESRSDRVPITVTGLCLSTSSLKALPLPEFYRPAKGWETWSRATLSQTQSLQPKPP